MNRRNNAFLLNTKQKSKVEAIVLLLEMLDNNRYKSNNEKLNKVFEQLLDIRIFANSINTYQARVISKKIGYRISPSRFAKFKKNNKKRDVHRSQLITKSVDENLLILRRFSELLILQKRIDNFHEIFVRKSVSNYADYQKILEHTEEELSKKLVEFCSNFKIDLEKFQREIEEKNRLKNNLPKFEAREEPTLNLNINFDDFDF